MTTPSTGAITLDDVNRELRISSGTSISMGDTNVRALARDTSGAISMSTLRNKSILDLGPNSILTSKSGNASGFLTVSATTTIKFNSNGTITITAADGSTSSGDGWSLITSTGLSTSNTTGDGYYEMRLYNAVVTDNLSDPEVNGSYSGIYPGAWTPGNEIMQNIGAGLTWGISATNDGGAPLNVNISADVIIREKDNVNSFVISTVSIDLTINDTSYVPP